MPGFDGTGPMGKGPGTGGKRGFCPEGRGARFNSGFYPPKGNAYGDSPYGEDIRRVRGWSMARAAVASPVDVEEAAVWAEDAGDKEIADERAHPKRTGCLSLYQT